MKKIDNVKEFVERIEFFKKAKSQRFVFGSGFDHREL